MPQEENTHFAVIYVLEMHSHYQNHIIDLDVGSCLIVVGAVAHDNGGGGDFVGLTLAMFTTLMLPRSYAESASRAPQDS